jgi:hypothetical protein
VLPRKEFESAALRTAAGPGYVAEKATTLSVNRVPRARLLLAAAFPAGMVRCEFRIFAENWQSGLPCEQPAGFKTRMVSIMVAGAAQANAHRYTSEDS